MRCVEAATIIHLAKLRSALTLVVELGHNLLGHFLRDVLGEQAALGCVAYLALGQVARDITQVLRNALEVLVLIGVLIELFFNHLVLAQHVLELELDAPALFLVLVYQERSNVLVVQAFDPFYEFILVLFLLIILSFSLSLGHAFFLRLSLHLVRMQELVVVRVVRVASLALLRDGILWL